MKDILERDRSGEPVSCDDPDYHIIKKIILEAKRLTLELNTQVLDCDEIRILFSELTGQKVGEDFTLWTPFYTDFGKNIRVGKNVFINHACTFMDRGGITIGDNVYIGPKVCLITENHCIAPSRRRTLISKPITILSLALRYKMKGKKATFLAVKIIVDFAMTVLFLMLMGYHLFENFQHEWMGASVFILFLAHNALNWKWYKNLFKGKYGAVRVLQTVVNALLWVVMICNIASALMLSRDGFYEWGLMNAGIGRRLHMISTVWTFLLISFHLGLHWQIFIGMAKKIAKPSVKAALILKWVFRAVALTICICGIVSFVGRRLWNEMFLLVEFKFMDYSESPVKFFAEHLAVLGLFTAIGHYVKSGLQRLTSHEPEKTNG